MLTLSKKSNYALIALAHLAERPGQVSSAREISLAYQLPLPRLMNILKLLHQHGIVGSTRGVKGGYRISANLEAVTLQELVTLLGCCGPAGDCGCRRQPDSQFARADTIADPAESTHAPVRALNFKLQRFLTDVKLSDLILPGRRIDVPLEAVRAPEKRTQRRLPTEWAENNATFELLNV